MVELSHDGTASSATKVEKWYCDHRAPNLTVAPGAEPKPNGLAFCPNTLLSAVPWSANASSPPSAVHLLLGNPMLNDISTCFIGLTGKGHYS